MQRALPGRVILDLHRYHVASNLEAILLVCIMIRQRRGTNAYYRYSRYTQVAARAVRQSLKETERADAERRAFQALRYQEWKNGEPSDHVRTLHYLTITD